MSAAKPNDIAATPRYAKLRAAILERIQSGQYAPGTRLPAEPEIAKEFGVSRMTANRAILSLVDDGWLNRKRKAGTFVAESTLSRRPVLAIEIPERQLTDEYFHRLYWELQRRITSRGGTVQIVEIPAKERVSTLRAHDADPMIFLGPAKTMHQDLRDLARTGTRLLVIGSNITGDGIIAIDSDNILGGALACSHLYELGHRNIGFVGAYPDDTNTVDRLRGFRAALQTRGIPFRQDRAVMCATMMENDKKAQAQLIKLLESPNRPTALFAAGAYIAMSVIGVASSIGLRVPHDLSIVGYDDPPFVSRLLTPLTTVSQPLEAMAALAADLVLHRINDSLQDYTTFEPTLIVRGTTAVPHTPGESK